MDLATIAIISVLFLAYALVSGRLEGTVLTAPLLFVAFGFLAGSGGLGFANIDVEHSAIHVIAELTLILVLFTDAARMGECEESKVVSDMPLREGLTTNNNPEP